MGLLWKENCCWNMKSWTVALAMVIPWILILSPSSTALHEVNSSSLASVDRLESLCSGLECNPPNSRLGLRSPRRLLSRTIVSIQKLWVLVLRLFGTNSPARSLSSAKAAVDRPAEPLLTWGGRLVSDAERASIRVLRDRISAKKDRKSRWMREEVQDVEILRFLRAREGNVEKAWAMMDAHDSWRVSPFGAESSFIHHAFNGSVLEKEVFWIGHDSNGCATLVVRSQIHDGYYYNNDPSLYVG